MTSAPETNKKKGPKWLSDAVAFMESLRGLLLLVGALVAGGGGVLVSSTFGDAGGADTAKIAQVADSVTRAQLAPIKAQLDSVRTEQAKQAEELKRQRDESRAVAGGLMDALPAFKKSIEDQGKETAEASRKKAERDRLLDGLTGGVP